MGIPLVALGIKPPQINDFATTQNNALVNQGLKNQNSLAPGNQQLQQQQIQENEMKLKQQQIAMQDQQTVQQVLGQTGGNVEQALPQLQGKISLNTFQGLLKANDEHKKALAEVDSKDLETQKYHADQLVQIGQSAAQMPDEQYLQNWPQIADAANKIKPELKLDPNNPLPKQQLQSSMLGLQVQSHYIAQEAEKRAQAKDVREQAEFEAKKGAGTLAGPVTEASLANAAAGGDPDLALKKIAQTKKDSKIIINPGIGGNDAKDIADAIENGDQPPTLTGLYKNAAPVRAELARRGVPIAKMELDWSATKKYMATLNSTQQNRLRQDITTVSDSLDKVEGLYNEWQKLAPTSGIKIFNKASLAAAKNLPGQPGAIAQALEAQIADTTAGLGTIYMGGNSPTDHSLGLAAKSLSADWNDTTFKEALKQARANVKIRQNSMNYAKPAGVGSDNMYAPSGGDAPTKFSPKPGAQTATNPKNNHKIVVDNGKWVDAETGAPI